MIKVIYEITEFGRTEEEDSSVVNSFVLDVSGPVAFSAVQEQVENMKEVQDIIHKFPKGGKVEVIEIGRA